VTHEQGVIPLAATVHSTADDATLVHLAHEGSAQAFTSIVERHRRLVYAVALAHLTDTQDAEDVVQETFLEAFLHIGTLENPAKLNQWLCSIARHRAINWAYRWRRSRELPFQHLDLTVDITSVTADAVEEAAAKSELRDQVRQAIASLPVTQREAVVLYYVGGHSQSEVAGILDVPLGTVKRRLHMARRRLREGLWDMMKDELAKERPSDALAVKVQLALAKAAKARGEKMTAQSLEHCDTALQLIAEMGNTPAAKDLRAKALTTKAHISWLVSKSKALPLQLLEEAVQIRDELGDKTALAQQLETLAIHYVDRDKRRATHERALVLFSETGDRSGEGSCLMCLGQLDMMDDLADALPRFEKALPLLDMPESRSMYAVCLAAIRLLQGLLETGKTQQGLLVTAATCEILLMATGGIEYAGQPGFGGQRTDKVLTISPLYELSQVGMIWSDHWKHPGHAWEGTAFSYSMLPLDCRARSLGTTSQTRVLAGGFTNCVCVEWTAQPNPNDSADQFQQELNSGRTGSKQAWFAPGVGLVRLVVQRGDGVHIDLQLDEYHIAEQSESFFPLAIGNRWSYKVTNISSDYVQERVLEAVAKEGDRLYLAHHGLVYR